MAVSIEMIRRDFERVLPKIDEIGRWHFRRLKTEQKEEVLAEMRALAWKYYRQCHENGRAPEGFVSRIAEYAAKGVKAGRRVAGAEVITSKSNPQTQKMLGVNGFSLQPEVGTAEVLAAVANHRWVSPADTAAFKIDTANWVTRLDKRSREIVVDLVKGETTSELAAKYKLSKGRISQIRRGLADEYEQYLHDGNSG